MWDNTLREITCFPLAVVVVGGDGDLSPVHQNPIPGNPNS